MRTRRQTIRNRRFRLLLDPQESAPSANLELESGGVIQLEDGSNLEAES